MVTKKVIQLGEDLRNDQRTIRELVTFSDEEITDEKIEDRKREVLRQIGHRQMPRHEERDDARHRARREQHGKEAALFGGFVHRRRLSDRRRPSCCPRRARSGCPPSGSA